MDLANSVIPIKIEEEMRTAFLDYSMSVIVSRALPDVRDGLKPVHRRILFAMHNLKNYHNRPYLKSARVVGEVIGRFHPHGDSPVYEAMVRLAQEFAEMVASVSSTKADGKVTANELAQVEREGAELVQACQVLMAHLRSLHEAGIPPSSTGGGVA